jgi:hypothetical protein
MTQQLFSPPVSRVAANVATGGFALVAFLQVLLALGVLPITMAWGGTQKVLTARLRVASLVAVVVLGLCGYVIRRRAGLTGETDPSGPVKVGSWIIAVYLAVNSLGNFTSSSRAEARLFGPLSLVVALSSLLVAASRRG